MLIKYWWIMRNILSLVYQQGTKIWFKSKSGIYLVCRFFCRKIQFFSIHIFIFLSLNCTWQLKCLYVLSRWVVVLQRCMWTCFRSVSTESSNINYQFKSIDLFYSFIFICGIWLSPTGSWLFPTGLSIWTSAINSAIWTSFYQIFNILLINKWYILRMFSPNQHFPSLRLIVSSLIELIFQHHPYEYSWLHSPFFIGARIHPHLSLFACVIITLYFSVSSSIILSLKPPLRTENLASHQSTLSGVRDLKSDELTYLLPF